MSAAEKIVSIGLARQIREQGEGTKRMKDGFVAIQNETFDALLRLPITQRQERVFLAILRKTAGFGKPSDCIASSQLAEMTGFHESHIRQALIDLADMGMILRGKRTKFGTVLTPVLAADEWNTERTESVHSSVRSYQIGANKRTDSAPHNRQLQQTTTPPVVPQSAAVHAADKPKRERKPAVTLQTWLETVQANGEQAIPADDPIFADAEKIGLPVDYLRICWMEFRDRYRDGDRKAKRYADWRATFRNTVRDNWFKLWAINADGECFLTTQGTLAMRRFKGGDQ